MRHIYCLTMRMRQKGILNEIRLKAPLLGIVYGLGGLSERWCDSSRRSLFTLIELLVVISIIALLASLLLPALNTAHNEAKRILCMSHLKTYGKAVMMYCSDENGRFPISDDPIFNIAFGMITWLHTLG